MSETKESIFIYLIVFSIFFFVFVNYISSIYNIVFDGLLVIILLALVIIDYKETKDMLFEKYSLNITKKQFIIAFLIGISLVVLQFLVLCVVGFLNLINGIQCPGFFVMASRLFLITLIPEKSLRILTIILALFFEPLFLEYVFRGVIYTNLREIYDHRMANLIQAILYSLFLISLTFLYVPTIIILVLFVLFFVFGLIFGVLREKFDNLSVPLVAHFVYFLIICFILL